MGRRKELLLEYQPTAGVNSDFEQLLQRFTSTETVRFEHFSEIWREMKMSFIYAGRDSERECREYTEGIMKMALKYILPPYNFQVRVGGLYLLYGLYYQQPLIRKARIRLTPDIWDQIIEFQTEARRQQHLDVNYVFNKLRVDDAFIFAATESEVFFNLNTINLPAKDPESLDEFKDEQTVLYDLFSDQFIQQLTQLHEHYHNVKVGLEGPGATEPSRSLNVIQTDIVPNIYGTVMTYQNRKKYMKKSAVTDTEDELNDEDYNPRGVCSKNIRSKLKAKAFRNVAKAHKSRRHRQAVESADESPEKPLLGRRKGSGEDGGSPQKKKRGKKTKIKKEHDEIDIEMENPEELKDDTCPSTSEEMDQGEIIPKEFLNMPMLAVDSEQSIPEIKKKLGRPKTTKTSVEKQKFVSDQQVINTPKKRGRQRKSNQNQNSDIKNPEKTPQKQEKGGKDKISTEQDKNDAEKGGSISSFDDVEEKKLPGKKKSGSAKKKVGKSAKGKMPSVKLTPLMKKKKGKDS